jgi:hypothetical protein
MSASDGDRTGCDETAERLEAYHYGDLDAPERAAVEAHAGRCARCRAELEAIAETAAALDRLEVPDPGEAEWARFGAKLEARVAPLRAERLALRAARRGLRSSAAGLRRVAAVLLIGGLGALSATLFFETRTLKSKLAEVEEERIRDLIATGDVPGARRLLVTSGADPRIEAALPKIEGIPQGAIRLYNLAEREVGKRQRELLLQILADYPRSWIADEAFAALQKRGDATPRRLDVAMLTPLPIVMRPLPGTPAAEHYAREIERLRALATPEQDSRFARYARFRAARVAEEDLGDTARALEEYRVIANAGPADALREAAMERIRAIEGRE